MSLWSRLFGGGKDEAASSSAAVEEYKGFRITPTPIREGGVYRISARIEKEVDGQARTHELIRADTTASLDEATTASSGKARQIIDEQGERLFS
ncbi:MAG: hypothetical protein JJT81_12225 [Rubellimicrobium sp.]|nr:hypothetical protein [Rubellimicrobium sp.]